MALLSPVLVQTESSGNSPIAKTMRGIRSWLASERIEPIYFKTVVGNDGLGFEISFREERDAERFRKRFASLLAGAPVTTASQAGEVVRRTAGPPDRRKDRPISPSAGPFCVRAI
jgi:hypothetical protein